MDDIRYPIGRFEAKPRLTPADRERLLDVLESFPSRLRTAVADLGDGRLDTAYREGGWTVRQLVHHLADAHQNGNVRFRWALTEEEPELKPYDQDSWAALPDSEGPIEPSLAVLDGIHARLASLLRRLGEDGWRRTLRHPEHEGVLDLNFLLQLYAFHGEHHLAHITGLRSREGWGR